MHHNGTLVDGKYMYELSEPVSKGASVCEMSAEEDVPEAICSVSLGACSR